MTELETRLISLLKASEAESKERENRLLAQVNSLRQQVEASAQQVNSLRQQVETSAQQVQKLGDQQKGLIEHFKVVVGLLSEEWN